MKKLLLQIYLMLRWLVFVPFLLFRETRTPNPDDIKKAVFFRNDRIGDMVASTPFFRAFKKAFPATHVTVVASERNAAVIEHSPYVDEIVLEKNATNAKVGGLDLAVDLFHTYALKSAIAVGQTGARFRLGFEVGGREVFFNIKGPAYDGQGSMTRRLLGLAQALGIQDQSSRPEIFLAEAEIAWAREYLKGKKIDLEHAKVAIHPGAYYPTQRWPLERFVELARVLRERLLVQVIVFCDKDEEARQAFLGLSDSSVHAFSYLSLREFIVLLGQCQMFIGNNSGPLHLAEALGLPTVSMMGPTEPFLWEPEGRDHLVLRKNIPCMGCGKPVCDTQECMKLISVEEVAQASESVFQKAHHGTT